MTFVPGCHSRDALSPDHIEWWGCSTCCLFYETQHNLLIHGRRQLKPQKRRAWLVGQGLDL